MVLADGEGGRGRVGRNHHLPQPLPVGRGVGVVAENEGSKNSIFRVKFSLLSRRNIPLEFTDNFQQVKLGEKLNGNFVALGGCGMNHLLPHPTSAGWGLVDGKFGYIKFEFSG